MGMGVVCKKLTRPPSVDGDELRLRQFCLRIGLARARKRTPFEAERTHTPVWHDCASEDFVCAETRGRKKF